MTLDKHDVFELISILALCILADVLLAGAQAWLN